MYNSSDHLMTNCSTGNSTSGSAAKPESAEHDVTTWLWAVGGPTILAVGVVGNVLILVTMTRRRMQGASTCVYLCAMAVLDLMVLVAGLTPNWLEGAEYVTIKVRFSRVLQTDDDNNVGLAPHLNTV